MNDEETTYEQNLGRLIQASCGAETHVTPTARHQLYQCLLAECRAQFAPDEFPRTVLGILTCVFLLLVAKGALAGLGRSVLPVNSSTGSFFYAVVLLNLLCLPAATLIIFFYRRSKSCLSI